MSMKEESLVGFDPGVTFSDSDSDDLYSVNVDEIKACAKAAASAKRECEEILFSSKPKLFKSSESKDAEVLLILSDDESRTPRTPLMPTSPDINSVKISSRKLVKMKKKTMKFFEKVDKLNFDDDCDLSLNQSGDLDVLCEKNVNHQVSVTIKCGTTITRMALGWLDNFGVIYQKICELHKVSFDQVVLSLRDTLLRPDQTPASVGLSIVDLIECGFIRNKDKNSDLLKKAVSTKQEDLPADSNYIQLKMQCSALRGVLYVTVNKFCKLAEAMNAYAKERGKEVTDFRFIFDGEKLDPDETGITLGLEGGECIDVYEV
ncbi:Rad60/SUMO-like domain [Trinorchestia longiramus]|nr:Rad60/SUMO-like domain [Trinorchestia longiramus]